MLGVWPCTCVIDVVAERWVGAWWRQVVTVTMVTTGYDDVLMQRLHIISERNRPFTGRP